MISNYSLKLAIGKAYASSNMTAAEKLAAEVVLYEYLLTVIDNDPTQANDVSSLVSTYKSKVGDGFANLKGRYTSYYSMIDYIGNLKSASLTTLSEDVIDKIYAIYASGTEIEEFSASWFSASEYGAAPANAKELEYLRRVHTDVMAPIIRYYSELYGAKDSDMKILSATLSDAAPGKMVMFMIEGINPAKVFSDLLAHRINVDFHDVSLRYPSIVITNI